MLDLGGNSVDVAGSVTLTNLKITDGWIMRHLLHGPRRVDQRQHGGRQRPALTVVGGTVVLTAANTYGGGTTIDVGDTLQLGDGTTGNDIGTIEGNVLDNRFDPGGSQYNPDR